MCYVANVRTVWQSQYWHRYHRCI